MSSRKFFSSYILREASTGFFPLKSTTLTPWTGRVLINVTFEEA